MSDVLLLDLLPARMDVNGDRGNVLAAVRRLAWAGIGTRVVTGDEHRWWGATPDLVLVSGPTAAGQRAALEQVGPHRRRLHEWVADGVPLLGTAGGFHLLLDELTLPGTRIPVDGLGLLGGSSRPAARRSSGFTVVSTPLGRVHGYHNLGQDAVLGRGTEPWGRVLLGPRGTAVEEGGATGRVLGTNLHGPLLPRNPPIADALVAQAAARRGLVYAPGERHRAVDAIAERANAVLRARAASRRSASYRPASEGRGRA